MFQGFYQLLETKVTVRCRKQDVQLVQVRTLSLAIIFPFLFFYCIMSLSGVHPEEYSHIQSRCEEQPGSSHRPEHLPLPGRVSCISGGSVAWMLLWILVVVFCCQLRRCGDVQQWWEDQSVQHPGEQVGPHGSAGRPKSFKWFFLPGLSRSLGPNSYSK